MPRFELDLVRAIDSDDGVTIQTATTVVEALDIEAARRQWPSLVEDETLGWRDRTAGYVDAVRALDAKADDIRAPNRNLTRSPHHVADDSDLPSAARGPAAGPPAPASSLTQARDQADAQGRTQGPFDPAAPAPVSQEPDPGKPATRGKGKSTA